MKNSIKILASAVMVLLLASCGNSQKNSGAEGYEANGLNESNETAGNYYTRDPEANDRMLDNVEDESEHSGVNTDNTTMQQNPNASSQQNPNASSQQNPNAAQGDYDRQRNQQMYSSLKMTNDQIKRYENASRTSLDTCKRDNPNKTLSSQDRTRIQNENLRSILDDAQYQNYEKWSADNPYQN